MQGKVPEFVRNDVEVAYLIDGEKASSFPEKSSKYNVTIECTGATGEWDKDKWGLTITNATAEKIKCSISFETKNTRNVTIHGAVQETITLSDGQTIETDITGIATAEVAIGETYTLTGSVSEYTSEEQIVEDTTTDLYAMPKGALYWYGNECTDITGGYAVQYDRNNSSYTTFIKNPNNIYTSSSKGNYILFVGSKNKIKTNGYTKLNVRSTSSGIIAGDNGAATAVGLVSFVRGLSNYFSGADICGIANQTITSEKYLFSETLKTTSDGYISIWVNDSLDGSTRTKLSITVYEIWLS